MYLDFRSYIQAASANSYNVFCKILLQSIFLTRIINKNKTKSKNSKISRTNSEATLGQVISITSLIIVDHKNEEITCSCELDNIVGISENVPATSEDFRRFSEDFRMLPKTSEDVPANFDYFRNHLKGDNLSVFLFRWDTIFQCLIGTFSWKLN